MTTDATADLTTPSSRPLALVTGASSGIGRHVALELANRGFDLVVCAEDAELADAAAELRATGAGVEPVRLDLRDQDAVDELLEHATASGRALDVAVLNAGVGKGGPFVENDLAAEQSIIDLNITSTTRLAKAVLRGMVAADHGRVMFTSSIASEMPGSFQAVYNASKSYVQSLAEALQEELRDSAVTVTSLMPGPTETEFFERGDLMDTKVGTGPKDDAAQVAAQGVEAMLAGESRVTGGGVKTRVQDLASKVVPDKVKAKMHRGMAEPGSAE